MLSTCPKEGHSRQVPRPLETTPPGLSLWSKLNLVLSLGKLARTPLHGEGGEGQPAPLEVPHGVTQAARPAEPSFPCLSHSKRTQAAWQGPSERLRHTLGAQRPTPSTIAPPPPKAGPWLPWALDSHQGLRLLASPAHQGAPVPLSPEAGVLSVLSLPAWPDHVGAHGGSRACPGLPHAKPLGPRVWHSLSICNPREGTPVVPGTGLRSPSGGASVHQRPALSGCSGTRSLATCTKGWPHSHSTALPGLGDAA